MSDPNLELAHLAAWRMAYADAEQVLTRAVDTACAPLQARIAELEQQIAEWTSAYEAAINTLTRANIQLAAYRAFRVAFKEWNATNHSYSRGRMIDALRKVEEVDPQP